MTKYISHKVVAATPMTRKEYNDLRGWVVPADEDPLDLGYLVEYMDGGKPNHPNFAGYISWSPKDTFDRGYRVNGNLTFGDAIAMLKLGHKVARAGWNGKDMWLSYTPGQNIRADQFWSQHNSQFASVNGGSAEVQPYITMKTAQGKIVPWLASQSDMLDNDWKVIDA